VIGVILTGYLNDGTAGMIAIKRCGGVCVVQDPADAAYPDMPQNVLKQIKVDHSVPIAEMGALFTKLLQRPVRRDKAVPEDLGIEARIAERVLSDLPSVEALGEQVPFNCPTMSQSNSRGYVPSAAARAKESDVHIARIRAMLRSGDRTARKK
jgi:two-component system, chemotaxis family, protein-glutamate methylesterase/glutaminase